MIIIFLLQLLIGTMIVLGLFGRLLNALQVLFKTENNTITLIILTIITIFFYGMIAYYYSASVDIYFLKHKEKILITVISFLLLTFMLLGPAKYADSYKEQRQIILAGSLGSIFFVVIRIIPSIGESVFGWLPVFIWV